VISFQYCSYIWNKVIRRTAIDRPPTFIVGCGHSGTSLLLAILGSHFRIHPIPYESGIALNGKEHFISKLKEFDIQAISAGKTNWIEKTPKHIYHIEEILEWCTDARIILIIRNGGDVASSLQARTGSLEKGIRRWVEDNLAGKAYWEHPSVHVVKYEDLIIDFNSTTKEILSFLGEGYDRSIMDYHKAPRKWYSNKIAKPSTPAAGNHEQHRNWQINQPLFDGRGRWKTMSEEDLSLLNDIGGDMLADLGYSICDS
jgi:sulfotransferase family protein